MKTSTLVALFVLLAATATHAADVDGLREVGPFEGIWKRCYEPGLEGVNEISSGYLVLMPDRRYYMVNTDCCYDPPGPRPPFWSLETWSVAGDCVTLDARSLDGAAYRVELTWRESARAVFFDDPHGAPVEVEALLYEGGEYGLNAAWCRVFPNRRAETSVTRRTD